MGNDSGWTIGSKFPHYETFSDIQDESFQEYKKAHGENNSGNFWDQHVWLLYSNYKKYW